MKNPRYITSIEDLPGIPGEEKKRLAEVTKKFAFRTNEYYASLIDWDDPEDPIRKIIIPDPRELEEWGALDPSNEKDYTVAPGVQHKYRETALFLTLDVCGGFCRFCFRKRLFMKRADETAHDLSAGIDYVRQHPEITNVLLTGGDSLLLATRRLERIISQVRAIDHVQIIRIGTKMAAFNPYRILNDPDLPRLIKTYSTPEKKIYLMAHFNHPRELTPQAIDALEVLRDAGAIVVNQTPLLRGINSDPAQLTELFKKLSFIGVPPYYVFQCRPTIGNSLFGMPVEESYLVFEKARASCSGLAKRARFVMSHASGKIEVVGKTDAATYFKYHQAADPRDVGRFLAFKSNPEAFWFDDYTDLLEDSRVFSDEDKQFPAFPSGRQIPNDTQAAG